MEDNISHTSYKAFADDGSKEEFESSGSSTASSSGWESADELEMNYQPIQFTAQPRPLRPAATKGCSDQEKKKKLRQKRERNRSKIVVDDDVTAAAADANVAGSNTTTTTSTYLRLNGKGDVPLSIPDQKSTGFHGGLAAEVASLALAMRNGSAAASELTFTSEQVIGDSTSDSEDSL